MIADGIEVGALPVGIAKRDCFRVGKDLEKEFEARGPDGAEADEGDVLALKAARGLREEEEAKRAYSGVSREN